MYNVASARVASRWLGKILEYEHGDAAIKKELEKLFAIDLNISREALSHYENGKRSPDVEMLRKLSMYFDVSIDFLINGKEFTKKYQ